MQDKKSDDKLIFLLTKEENQWKIKNFYSTDSLGFDEDKLPSFYFEQCSNQDSTAQNTSQTNERTIKPYVAFLQQDHPDPVDYIMGLFEKHDIVVLCERMHPEATQWDMIYDVVSDERFIDRVGNIFTEYGCVTLQPYLDDFMDADGLTDSEIETKTVHIMRNLGMWPMWDRTNFYRYLKKLYYLNQALPDTGNIHHHFSDVPFVWEGMTREKYAALRKDIFPKRDKIMADNIESKFKDILASNTQRKKCLVIMNFRHAFGPIRDDNGNLQGNTCEYLYEAFPGKVANVLINTVSNDLNMKAVLISKGVWDSAFRAVGNHAVGFDFEATPFGKDPFDMFIWRSWIKEKYDYQDVFTGFIFYQPLNMHILELGMPGFLEGFEDELLSRAKCVRDEMYEQMKNAIPTYKDGDINRNKPSYADLLDAYQ